MNYISGTVNMKSIRSICAILSPGDIDRLIDMGWRADISPMNYIWLVHINDCGLISFEGNGVRVSRQEKEKIFPYNTKLLLSDEIESKKQQQEMSRKLKETMKELGFKYCLPLD